MTTETATPPLVADTPLGFDPDVLGTFNELIRLRAEQNPTEPFVTFLADGDADERKLSFAELETRSLAVAALLRERGLDPGDRVLIMLDSGLEFIVTFFGILQAGMVPVPVYPPARLARLEHYLQTLGAILEVAHCRAGIADRRLVPLIAPRLKKSLVLISDTEVKSAKGTIEPYAAMPSSPGFLQFTSGTTSTPRGVLLLQDQILYQVRAYVEALDAQPGVVAVSWLPLYHDLGLIGNVLACLYARIHIVLLTPVTFLKDPMTWLRAITRYKASFSAAPNFAYQMCVRKLTDERLREEKIDLSSWISAGSGGECVSMATVNAFREKFGAYGFSPDAPNTSYGLAENCLSVSMHRHGEALRSLKISRDALQRNEVADPTSEEDSWTIVSNGRPLERMAVEIAGPDDAFLGDREIGEVWVQSPSLAAGYLHNGEATARTFPVRDGERWLRTGDLGFLADGDVYICGRAKDLMIVRGRNYHPQDLEEIAGKVDGVRAGNVAAFSVADTEGETERAVVVCELDDRITRDRETIAAEVGEALTGTFQLAAEVVLVKKGSIPKTSSGKLQRSLTKESYLRGDLEALAEPGTFASLALKLRLGLAAAGQKISSPFGRRVDAGGDAAPSDGGVEVLDPRIIEALRAARPELATPEPRLRVDALGLGSMELMEVFMALERVYDAHVDDADWGATQTLGEVQRLLEKNEGSGHRRKGSKATDEKDATPLFVRALLHEDPDETRVTSFRPPITAPLTFGFARVCSSVFWRQKVSGLENLPDPSAGSFILAGNHQTYIDGAWLRNSIGKAHRSRMVAMSWEGLPTFTRFFLGQVETIPIDPYGSFRGAMRAGLRALAGDRILLIFPEGSRTHTGRMNVFRPGVGLLSLLSQRPIVPFRLVGGFEIFPRHRATPRFFRWRQRRGDRLEIRFGAPIAPPAHEPEHTWKQARGIVAEVRRAVEAL